MRLKLHLLTVGIIVGLFLLPNISLACSKCFGASAKQVLHAYYVSIAFMALIPVGMIGAILTWIHRQGRRHQIANEKTN